MFLRLYPLTALAVVLAGVPAAAEQVRIRYCPQDRGTTTVLKTADTGQPTGVRISRFGLQREPYYCLPRTNCLKTYCHPCTGQQVTLPLYLPAATPRIAHTWSGISYQYTGFVVRVNFIDDGSVEVVYDNGPY